jgi:hypothetical protein
MKYLAIILFLLVGCTQINDTCAPTKWSLVSQDEMDELAKNADVGPGRGHVVGLCSDHRGKRAIYEVVGRDCPDTQIHEFCHLIDDFDGDWHAALQSLTDRHAVDWVPPEFKSRYARLQAFVKSLDALPEIERDTPYVQWAMLRAMFPCMDVVQHPEIIKGLEKYWPHDPTP